jgi:diguanylate cyclase (GGDEF)-like protein/PAS domain S-box-containing protein
MDAAITSSRVRITLLAVITSVAYYFLARLGISLSKPPEYIAAFWPPNAVFLVAILLAERRYWWIFFIAVSPAIFITSYQAGYSLEHVIIFVIANSIEVLVAAFGLTLILRRQIKLDRFRDMSLFLIWAVLIAPVISAFIASTTTLFESMVNYWSLWRIWFLADALGNLIITPVLLLAITSEFSWIKETLLARLIETLMFVICLMLVCYLSLGTDIETAGHFPALFYAPIVMLLWAALRFGTQTVCTALLTITLFAIWHAVHSRGPFIENSAIDNALSLQLFLVVISIPMMLLSALLSERKHIENKIQQNKERYQTLIEATSSITWTTDSSGGFIEPQPSWEKFTGQTWDEYKDFGWTKAIHEDDIEELLAGWKKACREITAYNAGGRIWNAGKKEWRYFEVQANPILNPDGSLFEWVGVVTDITPRKQVEEALKESETKYRTLFEKSADAILIILEDKFVDCNQATVNMLGYSTKRELLETHPSELSPEIQPDGRRSFEKANEMIAIAFEQGGHRFEWDHKRKNDEVFPVEVLLTAVPLGEITFLHVVWRDITERKQIENKLRLSEEKYRAMFETSIVGMAVNKADGTLVEFNQAYLDIIGYTKQEALKLTYWDITPKKYEEDELIQLQSLKDNRCYGPYEKDYIHKNGTTIPVLLNGVMITGSDGEDYTWSIIQNITDRKQTENEIRTSEEKYRILVESSPYCIHQINSDGKLISMNQAGLEMIHIEDENKIIGASYLDSVGDEDKERIAQLMEAAFSGRPSEFEFRSNSKQAFSSNFVPIYDQNNKVDRLLGITQDITESKKSEEQLSYQASHDALTGLVNRREFERRVERLLSTIKHDQGEHALCYMDLDQFKVVNDTCGHTSGDELLLQLSAVLSNTVRHRDTLARLGGDEFGVLMEHCSLDDAHRVATTLLKAIQDYHFVWEGHRFKVGVSIGLVPITHTTINISELLKDADAACYMAKDNGRNRIHVYHAEDEEITKRHGEMQWVERITHALEHNRFCLHAQVIEALSENDGKHYELLIRMLDEEGTSIPPGAFLPAAERYNLISKIDGWVIEKSFSLLTENRHFLQQINFCAINLSGQSLTDPNILDLIIFKLKNSELPRNKICFEITETSAISNLISATKFISTLKELGCRFALDDFGSGLSSFAYLKNLPVDYLKIDGMFVKDIVHDPIDHSMVKSINEVGHVMGMQTIAEFVENDMIKGMLKEIGVDYAQGYGIGKPRPFEELLEHSRYGPDSKN